MLLTGRHPQTTGHVVNFMRTRHSEIGLGDAFSHAGYKTGWVGKWHLHTGSFPQVPGQDYVPEGRDRLGFDYWRGYNFHTQYFGGWVNKGDWANEQWEGYETDALNRYAFEFLDDIQDEPFCLFISPHQPHLTNFEFAPEKYYDRLPEKLTLPENVPDYAVEYSTAAYRHYLAMTLAIDDMLGEILDYLDRTGKADNTLVIFSSDHGSQFGSQGLDPWDGMLDQIKNHMPKGFDIERFKRHTPWAKKLPYVESLRIPFVMRFPGMFDGGARRDTLIAPVDVFPTLCSICDIPIPRTVEGHDLSGALQGNENAWEQNSLLTMNFTASYDYLVNGHEWRGVFTKDYSYAKWLNGTVELFDLNSDPLQMHNVAEEAPDICRKMDGILEQLMANRQDELIPCTEYASWFDKQRRVIRNAYGQLGSPEEPPDWSLLS